MVFTNRARPTTIAISANGHTIKEVTKTKFLGVILDNKLRWNEHIIYIAKKISKSVAILKMVKFIFPSDILKMLYYSLVYPYFTYCNIIWSSAAITHLDPLIKLQKKAVRIISRAGYFDHTEALFKNLKLLQLRDVYNLNCAKFIYRCYNSDTYSHFLKQIKKNSDYHGYQTRNRNRLRKPASRLHQFDNSFMNIGTDIWNRIPDDIKSVFTLEQFKFKVRALILDKKL